MPPGFPDFLEICTAKNQAMLWSRTLQANAAGEFGGGKCGGGEYYL